MGLQGVRSAIGLNLDRTASRNGRQLGAGDVVPDREVTTIAGEVVALRQPGRIVHLQLRRFAGCPVCNLHLRSIAARNDELVAAGISEVVVFHSTEQELRKYEADLPFAVVADPSKRLYKAFGAEASPVALFHPRAWWPIVKAFTRSAFLVARGETKLPPLFPEGGRTGLPADFLIDEAGRVIGCHYGEHIYDQLPVDDVLAVVGDARSA